MTLLSRHRLSRMLDAILAGASEDAGHRAGHVGLEHEYTLRVRGEVVDFHALVHGLGLGARHLDPGDPNAYRLPSGAAVTADGAEAEIALPPARCAPGFSRRLARDAAWERSRLLEALSDAAELTGYSTHLSVSVPAGSEERIARLYAQTFAPAMMLLLDAAHSAGMLVRPRPGRLELCGEFVDGVELARAATFAVGSVRACVDAVTSPRDLPRLPPRLRVHAGADHHRYGLAITRHAFGGDLYASGRSTPLHTVDGRTTTAQAQLAHAWWSARRALARDSDDLEIRLVDRLITSGERLPRDGACSVALPAARSERPRHNVYGDALQSLSRPGYELAPVMLTWDAAVFVLAGPDRRRLAFAALPAARLAAWGRMLEEGRIDGVARAFLSSRRGRRRLQHRAQLRRAGLYDALGPRRRLLAREHDPPRDICIPARCVVGTQPQHSEGE